MEGQIYSSVYRIAAAQKKCRFISIHPQDEVFLFSLVSCIDNTQNSFKNVQK